MTVQRPWSCTGSGRSFAKADNRRGANTGLGTAGIMNVVAVGIQSECVTNLALYVAQRVAVYCVYARKRVDHRWRGCVVCCMLESKMSMSFIPRNL